MTLAKPADCWIAGHLSNAISAHGHQRHARTHTRCRCRCLTTGMATTNNDHVIGHGFISCRPLQTSLHVHWAYMRLSLAFCQLFANTETGKNAVQQILNINDADHSAKTVGCMSQIFRCQFGRRMQVMQAGSHHPVHSRFDRMSVS